MFYTVMLCGINNSSLSQCTYYCAVAAGATVVVSIFFAVCV